jgi:transcription initiation factor TFIIIB Brf1 subunit/transcription initiation factor TFIIB
MDKMRKLEANNRITNQYIIASANKIWQNQPRTVGAVASEAIRTVDLAHERNSVFFSGKSKRGIVGGLFYCLGLALRSFKTQKEIARILGTTEMTVRASSRDWQKQFPDLIKCE